MESTKLSVVLLLATLALSSTPMALACGSAGSGTACATTSNVRLPKKPGVGEGSPAVSDPPSHGALTTELATLPDLGPLAPVVGVLAPVVGSVAPVVGSIAPVLGGGAAPTVGGAAPMVGQVAPVVGGLAPVIGGGVPGIGAVPTSLATLAPVVGSSGIPGVRAVPTKLAPVVGGVAPVVGSAAPVVGSAAPIIGGETVVSTSRKIRHGGRKT